MENGLALLYRLALSCGYYSFSTTTSLSVTIIDSSNTQQLIPRQSLIAQGSQFPLRKPPGFHYDFFLLGITTFIAGLIGVPAPNGLIPQAPIHTTSLLVLGHPATKCDQEDALDEQTPIGAEKSPDAWLDRTVPVAVVEQRVSNLAQGCLCLVLLTAPLLHVLGLIPRGELAIKTRSKTSLF